MTVPGANTITERFSWRLVAWSLLTTFSLWPVAVRFYAPTAVGFIQLPGVIIFTLAAAICILTFLACPRRPAFPKIILLVIAIHAAYWMLYSVSYFWLHVRYGA